METKLLNGDYIISKDGDGFVLRKRVEYEVKDKETGDMVRKERYDNSFYSNYKNALIAVVRDCPEGCKDISAIIDRMDRLEHDILGFRC